ncbi:hypothetical protein SAMN04489726_6929 [Allokutzneria albata]|uniref:Uncharacterized protein n=1 Tax=Allokutzneria albata TaxID=211114 RepID=A0A1H0BYZ6_ALLAB|nr:hypothetical protein SAMN04489726_6929 [Allokutzneria albata]
MAFDILLVATAVAVGVALPSVLIAELRSDGCPKDCPCRPEEPHTRPANTALSAPKEGRSVSCISPGSAPIE